MAARVIGLFLVIAAAGCATKQDRPEDTAPESAQPAHPADRAIDAAADEAKLKREYDEVMFQRHMELAKRFRDAMELENALNEVALAIDANPTSDEALGLRSEVQRMLGDRAGETRTVIDDQYEAYQVRRQEQTVTVRRKLAQSRESMEAGDFDSARRGLDSALFIVASAKLSPLGSDEELAALGAQAEADRKELDRRQAQARDDQEHADTEAALREIAEIDEQRLLEARDRRARLLSSAIDHFNRDDFDTAERYANQVLREEPDNTVARDVVENARRARHTLVNERYLRELKTSFAAWQVDIEQTKIATTGILQWPSQSFWDRISQARAMRHIASGAHERRPEEQAVFNTLETRTISLPFDGTPFPQVVEYLAAASGVNFVIDPRAREDLAAVDVQLDAENVTIRDALSLIMLQASAEGEIVYEITGNVVRFIRKENQKKNLVLRIHPVADLTLGLTDFIPPQITQIGVDEDSETPLFGGQSEEAPQPYGTVEELMELVRSAISPATWEDGGSTMNAQGKNLIVRAPPEIQGRVAAFLDDLRAFAGIVVTVESRFLSITDAFLRDVGVDFRGLGGTNSGPLAVLDDVTDGLVNNTSAGYDNGGPGVDNGAAALSPSSGFYFNDGADGDFRGRTENIFSQSLGGMLSALGGGTFQLTYIDDVAVSAIVRATEKSADLRSLTAPALTVYNTQRAHISTVNQISFVQDFDVEVAQTAFIADPVIGVIQDGLTLDVRPTVSNDRRFITLDVAPTLIDLQTPIQTFQTLLGAAVAPFRTLTYIAAQNPVVIQLPEIGMRTARATVRVPDGGSILMAGLKEIQLENLQTGTPVLSEIPLLGFLFQRKGKSEDVSHLMIIVTATITDIQEQLASTRG